MARAGDETIIRACWDAILNVGISHPHLLMVHARVRDLYEVREDLPCETLAIDADGSIKVHPEMVAKHRAYLGFGIAHELLHLVLGHHKRAGHRDPELWGKAIDMVINTPLREAGLRCPDWAIYLPHDFFGERSAEEVYEWLRANPARARTRPASNGKPRGATGGTGGTGTTGTTGGTGAKGATGATGAKVGAGCSPLPGKRPSSGMPAPDGGAIDWEQVRREAEAIAQQAGIGTSPLARVLVPRSPRTDWRDALRYGFTMGRSVHSRDYQTYARPSRRNQVTPLGVVVRPGWRGFDPSIAVLIDVSGSMDRAWIEQIVAEVEAQSAVYPGSRLYVVVHTDRVVAAGWVRAGGSALTGELRAMMQFTGGTDASGAYRRIREEHARARFSVVVHFTDCELLTRRWPAVPDGVRLVVAAFGSGATHPATPLPDGAIHMPIEVPHDDTAS